MRISKQDIPVKINAPGAIARQQQDFGDASGYGDIGAEYFTMAAGTDLAGLLEGLEGDACQAPHWGYLIKGEVTVSYTDGNEETVRTGVRPPLRLDGPRGVPRRTRQLPEPTITVELS